MGCGRGSGWWWPFLRKAGDFRNWGTGLRWALHIVVVAALLIVLAVVNSVYFLELSRLFPDVPPSLRKVWLLILFLLLYIFSWLLRWLLSLLTPEVEAS